MPHLSSIINKLNKKIREFKFEKLSIKSLVITFLVLSVAATIPISLSLLSPSGQDNTAISEQANETDFLTAEITTDLDTISIASTLVGEDSCIPGTSAASATCIGWNIDGNWQYVYPNTGLNTPGEATVPATSSQCKEGCDASSACRSWVFVPGGQNFPGSVNNQNTCYQKSTVGTISRNANTISGFKGDTACNAGSATSSSTCQGFDIAGDWQYVYPNTGLNTPGEATEPQSAQQCKGGCDADSACKSWVFVPGGLGLPGAVGDKNTCYQKSTVGTKTSTAGLTSGFKTTTTGGGGGGNNTHTLTVTLNPTSYKAGDYVKFCYGLVPTDPYTIKVFNGTETTPIIEWGDDGSGDCISDNATKPRIRINTSAAPGTITLRVEAHVSGSKVAEKNVTLTVTGGPTVAPTAVPPTPTKTPTPTLTPVPTSTPAPTVTPNPTATPGPTMTPNPTPTGVQPTATPGPTATPNPTAAPNETRLTLDLRTTGIGKLTGENNSPTPPTRNVFVEVYNLQNQKIKDAGSFLLYSPVSGSFKGEVSLENTLQSGPYILKIRFGNTLKRAITVQLNAGQTNTIAAQRLITGDVVADNQLNLIDYNAVISCIRITSCQNRANADLNLDGKVDELDLNILYSEFITRDGD